MRSVFLDISKDFDNVWLKGLLFKLSQYGISGNLLDLLSSFLSARKQRVLLNGQTLSGEMSPQASLKVSFWDHCYFCYI